MASENSIGERLLAAYYGATVLFVLLDYVYGFNVRLSFLDDWPALRALYYLFCLGCFALIWRRPAWSGYVSATESLVTISALITGMALRVMIVTDAMIDDGTGFVSLREIINFLLAGSVAYLALQTQMTAISGPARRR